MSRTPQTATRWHLTILGACLSFQAAAAAASDSVTLADLQAQTGPGGTSMLFMSQEQRRLGFRHIDDLYPTREIKAGDSPYPLKDGRQDLSGVTYEVNGERFSVGDFMGADYNKGFIVVRNGNVLLEHYGEGHDRNTRWVSFSVAKSVTSMLIGAAVRDGYIESIDEPVASYLPRFRGTPYEDSTIRNVLQMSSGVAWNEDYADPDSDVSHAGGLNGIELVRYLSQLPREAEPGEVFSYNTGETNLVGEILRAAIGNNASTYLTHKIWGPFGMESDASWMLGSVAGGETGGCCINATLRDYARIGLFAMHDGMLPDGTRVLPEGWMAESIAPSKGYEGYGYLWWPRGDGNYSARGIFGQQITVAPEAGLVIALHSNAPAAVGTEYHEHVEAAVAALIEHLSASS